MPYLRFNVEASVVEPGASFDVRREPERVVLRFDRVPSAVVLTMTPAQATAIGRRLLEKANGEAKAQSYRRPGLPPHQR